MTENIRREAAFDAEFEEVNENNENIENSENVTADNSNTVTAALVLGIAGVISAFTGKFAVIGLVCSAVGLVLSSRERASNPSGTVTINILQYSSFFQCAALLCARVCNHLDCLTTRCFI